MFLSRHDEAEAPEILPNADGGILSQDGSGGEIRDGMEAAGQERTAVRTEEDQGLVDYLARFRKESPEPHIQNVSFSQASRQGLVDTDREFPPAETKGRDRRRERISMEVHDLRSRNEGASAGLQGVKASQESEGGQIPGTELIVELRGEGKREADTSRPGENRVNQSFQDLLARELRDGLNTDIVRHASLILKDGGEGMIRLSLRPESLGNVKIRLEMAENKITGQIIVESDEALKAFEREIRSLEQAFKDSGFDGASLEMSVSSGGGWDGTAGQWKGEEARPFFSERFVSSSYDAASENGDLGGMGQGVNPHGASLNLLA
ncbi:flagellar hook-length control protein FliK [Treponema sp. OttesenSCG-928-L16]|nr:flagellar hook-length control protein FliK [Treponema sp. OttesenSCG-928-L16]